MLIKSCFQCKFHQTKQDQNEQTSYCQRENCWSQYSKCVADQALRRFLEEERT